MSLLCNMCAFVWPCFCWCMWRVWCVCVCDVCIYVLCLISSHFALNAVGIGSPCLMVNSPPAETLNRTGVLPVLEATEQNRCSACSGSLYSPTSANSLGFTSPAFSPLVRSWMKYDLTHYRLYSWPKPPRQDDFWR